MSGLSLKALLLLGAGALSLSAAAQLAYKCGNSYSQTPCPGAVTIDTADRRSGAQKTQTDMATQRDARVAGAMEKARLQQEAKDLAANTPARKASAAASAPRSKAGRLKKNKGRAQKQPNPD